jgi:hypothetical protein
MVDEKIFYDLNPFFVKVSNDDCKRFMKISLDDNLPDEYVFETKTAWYKINKKKMEFRILCRKNYDMLDFLDYPSVAEIDESVLISYKLAKRCGFKVFLENKFSN